MLLSGCPKPSGKLLSGRTFQGLVITFQKPKTKTRSLSWANINCSQHSLGWGKKQRRERSKKETDMKQCTGRVYLQARNKGEMKCFRRTKWSICKASKVRSHTWPFLLTNTTFCWSKNNKFKQDKNKLDMKVFVCFLSSFYGKTLITWAGTIVKEGILGQGILM